MGGCAKIFGAVQSVVKRRAYVSGTNTGSRIFNGTAVHSEESARDSWRRKKPCQSIPGLWVHSGLVFFARGVHVPAAPRTRAGHDVVNVVQRRSGVCSSPHEEGDKGPPGTASTRYVKSFSAVRTARRRIVAEGSQTSAHGQRGRAV